MSWHLICYTNCYFLKTEKNFHNLINNIYMYIMNNMFIGLRNINIDPNNQLQMLITFYLNNIFYYTNYLFL